MKSHVLFALKGSRMLSQAKSLVPFGPKTPKKLKTIEFYRVFCCSWMKSHVLFALMGPRMLSQAKRYRTFCLWRWYFLHSGQTARDFSRTGRTVRHFLYSGQGSRTVRPNGAKRRALSDLSAKSHVPFAVKPGRPSKADCTPRIIENVGLQLPFKTLL